MRKVLGVCGSRRIVRFDLWVLKGAGQSALMVYESVIIKVYRSVTVKGYC